MIRDMDIKIYKDALNNAEKRRFRIGVMEKTGCKAPTSYQYVDGALPFPAKIEAVRFIEEFSKGQVTRHDVRPDVYGEKE